MERNETAGLDRVWCVVPVYNNKDTVRAVALGCREHVPNVLVVDDGSTDTDVPALFKDTGITVARHDTCRGKGQAILTGLRHVRQRGARFMIIVDADGQHLPSDLPKFLPLLAEDADSIVIGCRDFDQPSIPKSSRFGRAVSNFWVRIETGIELKDTQSGFRAYPVEHMARLGLRASRYDFEIEVLVRAAWAGLRIKEVDVGVWYPPRAERVSHFRPWLDNLRITHLHMLLVGRRLLPWPHRKLVKRPSAFPSLIRQPKAFFLALLRENATPAGLAASAAVGTFIGILPIQGAHSLAILYVTARLNLNKVMALAIQGLFFPPLTPLFCISLGYYVRHGTWLWEVSRTTFVEQLHLRLWEWVIGSLIFAPVAAAIAATAVYWMARRVQEGSAPRA